MNELERLSAAEELLWIDPDRSDEPGELPLGMADILDASDRLERFAPLIERLFPGTPGIIESALDDIPAMAEALGVPGRLLLKRDDSLPIAGSVKARGGIYEVLKHTETLCTEAGLLTPGASTAVLAEPEARAFLARHSVQVGSTGNLGLSIGVMSAALGYRAVVHMSADARQWKKDLLRSRDVTVCEYASDYSEAVRNGRLLSDRDPLSYFVDDENSRDLFLGYSVAALRLKEQLEARAIEVSKAHPLMVYLPCGVGGAPGGITFGLRQVFGTDVHCFFAEPTQAPCMLLGMLTGRGSDICVQDIGLTGITEADGLAVGRPSGFVGSVMRTLLDGACTVSDAHLFDYLRLLEATQHTFIEPSSCAAFRGPEALLTTVEGRAWLHRNAIDPAAATHICWATGGSMVPDTERARYLSTHL